MRTTGHKSPGNLSPAEIRKLQTGKPCKPPSQVSEESREIGNLVFEWKAAGFSDADIRDEVERERARLKRREAGR